jgi:hypothetical protein
MTMRYAHLIPGQEAEKVAIISDMLEQRESKDYKDVSPSEMIDIIKQAVAVWSKAPDQKVRPLELQSLLQRLGVNFSGSVTAMPTELDSAKLAVIDDVLASGKA